MSTVVSETIPTMEKLKTGVKPSSKLVRASSIEKIKELNNYICSQQYYVIPALLNWIKSSQNGLENSLERTITIYRYMLYNVIMYSVFKFNQICKDCATYSKVVIQPNLKEFIYKTYLKCSDSDVLLKIGVYSLICIVSLEFLMCIYLLFLTYVPIGLIFLLCCVGSTIFLFYESIKSHNFREKKRKSN